MYHCHLYPPQAANGYRNSRLVVDEDDLKYVKKVKKIAMYWLKSFMKIFLLKPSVLGKLGLFSGM